MNYKAQTLRQPSHGVRLLRVSNGEIVSPPLNCCLGTESHKHAMPDCTSHTIQKSPYLIVNEDVEINRSSPERVIFAGSAQILSTSFAAASIRLRATKSITRLHFGTSLAHHSACVLCSTRSNFKSEPKLVMES